MIEFMVIGLPRSGTTWAANWLTTDATLCVHDPLWTTHYNDFNQVIGRRAGSRIAGIACSGIWNWVEWLNRHPARKLILHRDIAEVRRSLASIGLPEAVVRDAAKLDRIEGRHVDWEELFDPSRAADLWDYLTGLPFDAGRHGELRTMRVEPLRAAVKRDAALNARLAAELANSTLG